MTGKSDLIVVARIVAPFGRVGEVKALLETDYPRELAERKRLIVTEDRRTGEERNVERVRFHKGAALIKLAGVETINDAEQLRGQCFAVRAEERAALGETSFWIDDVIGLDVFTEGGASLGSVREVLRGKANDVWVTPGAMIPAVRDFVVSVDLEQRRIVVRDIEGLETAEEP